MICPAQIKQTSKSIAWSASRSAMSSSRTGSGSACWVGPAPPSICGPAMLGSVWTDAQRQAARHLVACNARFALLTPKGRSPNLASHCLSLNLQRLSADWLEQYGHPIALVETFLVPAGPQRPPHPLGTADAGGLGALSPRATGPGLSVERKTNPKPARRATPIARPPPQPWLATPSRCLHSGHCRRGHDCGQ